PELRRDRVASLRAAAREAEAAAVVALEHEPLRHVLLDANRHLEVLAQQLDQSFGMAAAAAEQPGLEQPRPLGQRARRRAGVLGAEARTEPGAEAIAARTVVMYRRLRVGPGPVEEREQPVMEDVEEARERRVAAEAKPLAH